MSRFVMPERAVELGLEKHNSRRLFQFGSDRCWYTYEDESMSSFVGPYNTRREAESYHRQILANLHGGEDDLEPW